MARRTLVRRMTTTYKGMNHDQLMANYPVAFLRCRGGHSWPERAMWRDISDYAREKIEVCRRCGYTKTVMQGTDGRPINKEQTSYSPGYLTPGFGLRRADFKAVKDVRDYEWAKAQGRVLDVAADEVQSS